MKRIDLNRLREALRTLGNGGEGVRDVDVEATRLALGVAVAVAKAPTVWWCGDLEAGEKDEGTFGDGTCSICGNTPRYKGCGYAVVVPVKGES